MSDDYPRPGQIEFSADEEKKMREMEANARQQAPNATTTWTERKPTGEMTTIDLKPKRITRDQF